MLGHLKYMKTYKNPQLNMNSLNKNRLFSDIKYMQNIAKKPFETSQSRVMFCLYSISLNKQFWFNKSI